MSDFTPGPWRMWRPHFDYEGMIFADNSTYAVAQVLPEERHTPERRGLTERNANARLIAAAPDLLAVAKLAEYAATFIPSGQPEYRQLRDLAHAAIARALGEEVAR